MIAAGNITNQHSIIIISKRWRGKLARTNTKKKTKNIIFNSETKKRSLRINELIKIIIFSPKKIKENSIAPYSTLNPETSSDSHSDKSKGVRLSSIMKVNRIKIKHILIE